MISMDYDLDFDAALLDYHAKVDDLPYLDLFHDDKLDFCEERQDCTEPGDLFHDDKLDFCAERQDCTEPGDAATPENVFESLLNTTDSTPELSTGEQSSENSSSEKSKSKQKTNRQNTTATSKDTKETGQDGTENPSTQEEPPSKRLRRSTREYNLRQSSIINRIETEVRQAKPKEPKPKSKPPPLSKYRRRTANGRERTRMAEINDAFEVLRLAIPDYPTDQSSKLTKITTLRLAMNYIGALRDMLGYPSTPSPASPGALLFSDNSSSSIAANNNDVITKTVVNQNTDANMKSNANTKSNATTKKNTKPKGRTTRKPRGKAAKKNSTSATCTVTSASSQNSDAANVLKQNTPVCTNTIKNDFPCGFPSTVPSPSSTISSPGNLNCLNSNLNCLSPSVMSRSPDSMNCVSPALSFSCSSPSSSISEAPNYFNMAYLSLSNPLDSEGESLGSLS